MKINSCLAFTKCWSQKATVLDKIAVFFLARFQVPAPIQTQSWHLVGKRLNAFLGSKNKSIIFTLPPIPAPWQQEPLCIWGCQPRGRDRSRRQSPAAGDGGTVGTVAPQAAAALHDWKYPNAVRGLQPCFSHSFQLAQRQARSLSVMLSPADLLIYARKTSGAICNISDKPQSLKSSAGSARLFHP